MEQRDRAQASGGAPHSTSNAAASEHGAASPSAAIARLHHIRLSQAASPSPSPSPSPFSPCSESSRGSSDGSDGDGDGTSPSTSAENSPASSSPTATPAQRTFARTQQLTRESSDSDADENGGGCVGFRPRTVSFPGTSLRTIKPPHPAELRSTRPRVLVTGGAGFIGSHVARALLARGEDIVIVDELNSYYAPSIKLGNLKSLTDAYGHARVHTYVADICDQDAMQQCYETEKFDRIVHLAARAGVRPSIHDPLLYERSNVQGTLVLLELAKRSKGAIKHFVYASSSSVYGDEAPIPFTEADACNTPVSVYAATKKSCELLASTYAHLHSLPCSGLRFFTVFGPSGREDMAPFMFIDRLSRGLPLTQFGDGTTSRDYTFISDIVDGVLLVLDHVPATPAGAAAHEVYNLGAGSPIILRDFIATIARELGVTPNIIVQPKQPGDVDRTFADIAKARLMLGYEPKVSVQEGIRRTVAWYLATKKNVAPSTPEDSPCSSPTSSDLINLAPPPPVTISTASARSSTFPPLPACLVATRIHNQGSSRLGLSPDMFAHLLIWLPRALACGERVALAVDTTGGKRDILDAVARVLEGLAPVDRARVDIVAVSPWQAFVPALNALLAHARSTACSTILYSSLEMQMHPAHVHTLRAHLHADTLVVGARLSGHRFVRGAAVLDGCSTVWNTLALWCVTKLLRTGFLTISDGLPEREMTMGPGPAKTLPPVAGGVEEVACISAQQIMFPTSSQAKLLSMTAAADEWTHGAGESVAISHEAQQAAAFTTSATSEDAESDAEDDEEESHRSASHNHAHEQLLYDDIVTPATTVSATRSTSAPMAVASLTHLPRRLSSSSRSPRVVASACTVGSASKPRCLAPSITAVPSLFWDAHFGGDLAREAAHEKKMRSKVERAQQQLDELQLKPGTVQHIHVVLPSA